MEFFMTKQKKFFKAAEKGDMAMVKKMIGKGVDVNAKDKESWTALMVAAIWGRVDIVNMLIENGADINIEDKKGRTALTIAIKYAKTEIVKLLLEKGAIEKASEGDGKKGFRFCSIKKEKNKIYWPEFYTDVQSNNYYLIKCWYINPDTDELMKPRSDGVHGLFEFRKTARKPIEQIISTEEVKDEEVVLIVAPVVF